MKSAKYSSFGVFESGTPSVNDSDGFIDTLDTIGKTKSVPIIRQLTPTMPTSGTYACPLPVLLAEWKIRLHGESNTGKTSLAKALCRSNNMKTDISETPGLMLRYTIFPLKLQNEHKPRFIRLDIEEVGALIQSRRKYLKFDISMSKDYDAHVVLFSMTDPTSLASARNIIEYLITECQVSIESILCVGTKVDQFHSYQITEIDLEEFVEKTRTSLCLVNTQASWIDDYGAYIVAEEIASIILTKNRQQIPI